MCLDIPCEWQMIHMKCQDSFSLKSKKKNFFKISSAAVVIGTLKVEVLDMVDNLKLF